jgi:hypothetical protein
MTTETEIVILNTTFEKLKYHLDKSKIFYDMAKSVNREIPITIYPRAAKEKISINQWVKNIEDCPKQMTVVASVRLSYDGVRSYFHYDANKFLINYTEAKIRTLSYDEAKQHDFGGKSFDVVFEIEGEIIPIEIKITQSTTDFMGSTHSPAKVDDYIFVALRVDRETPIEVGKNYLKGMVVDMKSYAPSAWKGTPKINSSRTTLTLDSHTKCIVGSFGKKTFIYEEIIYE